jgi:hypothetical protein
VSSHGIDLAEFVRNNPVATSTVLVRRDVLTGAGGFDESFRGPEDFDLWMRIGTGHALRRLDCPLSRYRVQAGSLSMDERRFLPEVLRVLEKAFAPGGALSGHPEWRGSAISNQLWNASWMAFNRGARGTAIALWARAYARNLQSSQRVDRPWLRLLLRYVVGKREC